MPSSSFNATITSADFGSRQIRVTKISSPLNIVASADSEARSRRAFYPTTVDGSAFRLVLAFKSYAERESFNTWMNKFMVGVSEGSAKHGTMTVQVPSRKFIQVGVPQGEVEYGQGVLDVGYEMTLTFLGAKSPVNLSLSSKMAGVSYLQDARSNPKAQFFYPSSNQVKGAASLDGAIFDTPGPVFGPQNPFDVAASQKSPVLGPISPFTPGGFE